MLPSYSLLRSFEFGDGRDQGLASGAIKVHHQLELCTAALAGEHHSAAETFVPDTVAGAPPGEFVSVSISQLGAPVGTTDTVTTGPDGSATIDTGFFGRITSGAVEATVSIRTGASAPVAEEISFDATAINPWYLTAAGIISVILVLFAIAGIESYLRAFRRGRNRLTTYVGLLVTGALFGGATAVASTIIFGTGRELIGIYGPAALGAAGALALGLATRANRKRRRSARQELRHTAIKALAKR